jgi:hypothetical protein
MKKLLTILLLAVVTACANGGVGTALLLGSAASEWTPPSGCVLWLSSTKSGNVAALGTWPDQSGGGRNVTLVGDTVVTSGTGMILSASGDGAVSAGSYSLFGGTQAFTMAFWTRITATTSYPYISTTNPGGTLVGVLFGSPTAQSIYGKRVAVCGFSAFNYSQWYHVALTYDGADLQLWKDGETAGTAVADSASLSASSAQLNFGSGPPAPQGYMDEILWFQRALDLAGINDVMNGTANGRP